WSKGAIVVQDKVHGVKEDLVMVFGQGNMVWLVYVNSTVSEKVKVEKTVPAFKAWSSNLFLKRQQEELNLKGFGLLPISLSLHNQTHMKLLVV
ncbi:hypothetical protein Tco_0394055, partial [Tanacetum coccineum]